jgi:phospholipase/carboxylesterase
MQADALQQLWIELPPINGGEPQRLLIFLHGAGSNPDAFAPVAIAWQLKFPTAAAFVLQASEPSAVPTPEGLMPRFDWFSSHTPDHAVVRGAALTAEKAIRTIQSSTGLGAHQTIVIGYSQGATVALDIARLAPNIADKITDKVTNKVAEIVVAYAGQLSGAILADEKISASALHLIHGELDSIVTLDKAQRAYAQLMLAHGDVTLDILEDGKHTIDQDSINVGTTRVMQTIFRGRKKNIPSPKNVSVNQLNSAKLH